MSQVSSLGYKMYRVYFLGYNSQGHLEQHCGWDIKAAKCCIHFFPVWLLLCSCQVFIKGVNLMISHTAAHTATWWPDMKAEQSRNESTQATKEPEAVTAWAGFCFVFLIWQLYCWFNRKKCASFNRLRITLTKTQKLHESFSFFLAAWLNFVCFDVTGFAET